MNLGFIGSGEITKAVVRGIINSKINYKKYIFQRNIKISRNLKKKVKK